MDDTEGLEDQERKDVQEIGITIQGLLGPGVSLGPSVYLALRARWDRRGHKDKEEWAAL